MANRSKRFRNIFFRVGALVFVLLVSAVLYNLSFPRITHLREFDADEVARLETAIFSAQLYPLPPHLMPLQCTRGLNSSIAPKFDL